MPSYACLCRVCACIYVCADGADDNKRRHISLYLNDERETNVISQIWVTYPLENVYPPLRICYVGGRRYMDKSTEDAIFF